MEEKLAYVKQAVDELGREAAVLKLSKQYSREEISYMMDQLDGRALAKEKFPFLASIKDIIYPPSYYLEQTSSERTARFKAALVEGSSLLDMTGGFGIDAYFFSTRIPDTWYVEQDPVIYSIALKNLALLAPNIKTVQVDSVQFLLSLDKKMDWIYLDPIRRSKDRRLNRIEDYSPNIIQIQEELFTRADNLMVKLSPMTDISQLVKTLGNKVKQVCVVSVDNECKELLVVCDGRVHEDPIIESINLSKEKEERFVSSLLHKPGDVPLSDPLEFLYEPNASIYKSQQYDQLAKEYSLFKLHPNTHLYTAAQYHEGYQGRIYRVRAACAFDAKSLQQLKAGSAFNIKTRNFPLRADEVAKKLKVREGGEAYLFCVKLKDEKLRLLVCEKLEAVSH